MAELRPSTEGTEGHGNVERRRKFRVVALAIVMANRLSRARQRSQIIRQSRVQLLATKAALIFIGTEEAALEARLLAAQKTAALRNLSKVPATAVRLFVCGDGFAGKTTLMSTLSSVCCYKPPQAHTPRHGYADILVQPLSFILNFWTYLIALITTLLSTLSSLVGLHKPRRGAQDSSQSVEARTRGIQVYALERDGIRLSTWDMAGQPEFHAFHDHMIPDTSDSSAMFMFLWSPLDSKDESKGNAKTEDDFKESFHYWLRFIAAKSQQSKVLRRIIVVLTRQDQTSLVLQALNDSIQALRTSFRDIFEVVGVFEVDARSPTSVQPLLSCIFETAKDVLKGVEIYGICAQVSEYLATEPTIKEHGPIMSWASFSELCTNQFNVIEPQIQKAIAYSLNESGCLIYLSHLPFLVLDPNWFCNVVMGSLIHFPHSPITLNSKGRIPIVGGYTSPCYLEAILKEISQNRVEGRLLMDLLEAMHVFCRVPGDGDGDGKVFIPSTLYDINTLEVPLQWRGTSDKSFTYAGRRLECDRKDLTFLTPGFFHMIQVLFNKAFLETKSGIVQLAKGSIFICKEDLQIIVEWALAKREHVIDVMVRAPQEGDVKGSLDDVANNIIKTLARVCAQPMGNQGVVLVASVIRPDCLNTPAPSEVRADQCALMVDLKQELRRNLEEGRPCKKWVHVWPKGRSFDGDCVYNHLIDMLGVDMYEKELLSYKKSLQDASKLLQCTSEVGSLMENVELGYGCTISQGLFESGSTSTLVPDHLIEESTEMENVELGSKSTYVSDGMKQKILHSSRQDEEDGPFEEIVTKQLARLVSQMIKLDGKLDVIDGKLDVMHGKLDVMHTSIMELRTEVLTKIQTSVEQFLNFVVENERGRVPRFVFLTTEGVGLKRRMVTALLPDVTSVRIELFCEHAAGPHRVKGQKGLHVSTVKGGTFLKKALPYVQGFLKVLTVLLKVGAHVAAGVPGSTIPDFSRLIALAMDTPGFLESETLLAKLDAGLCAEDFLGWEEWLVSELTKKKGPNQVYSGIAELFGLRHSRSKDLKGAWLCEKCISFGSLSEI